MELLVYSELKPLFQISSFSFIYLFTILFFVFGFVSAVTQFRRTQRTKAQNWIIGLAMTFFVSKLFMFLAAILKGIVSYGAKLVEYLFNFNNTLSSAIEGTWGPYFVVGVGIVAFLSMIYGITVGKYKYSVERVPFGIKNLAPELQGLKIVQISDIHSGTFDSVEQVEKGIRMINDLQPDLVLFTGDLVNYHMDEIDPYVDAFSKIDAKYGKYAILGNHDYYGYHPKSGISLNQYFDGFVGKHRSMGFQLLRNESIVFQKNDANLNIIGVENWGAGGFPKTGDLDRALVGIDQKAPSILMSHDPTHWDHAVKDHKTPIELTLSGHTHGMQFGINLPFLKWSPVQYRYRKWMGLYQENDRSLYVNRGFGFLGFPGRVFMWPEITLIELQKA